ncbi:MAG: Gfo/Idh/MocA family protein [Candidatus Zipacnadales bacterium]
MKTYRLGVAMMVHDHVWGELGHWSRLSNVVMVAAADPHQPLRERIQAEYGVAKLYESPQEMLDNEELDLLQIASENATAVDIVEYAAPRGIHMVVEKPMAARLSQADRMFKAAQEAGVVLMVNWPTQWSPAFQTLTRLIEEGAIGKLFYLKYRAAHNGPKEIGCSEYFWSWLYNEELNGAGALMDYCCYSAAMNAYFLGLPNSCVGIRSVLVKDYPLPDDNAMILMKYPHAFGVAEACWTQKVRTEEPNPIAYGTEGMIGIKGGKVVIRTAAEPDEKIIEPDPLAEGYRNGPEHLIHCIETGEKVIGTCNALVSRNAQAILEAGLISADTGREVACEPLTK